MSRRSSVKPRITIATAGLGVLPETRLKVACTLLMADRMQVDVVAWGASEANILVADNASLEGSLAIDSARQLKLPTLTLGRTPSSLLPTLSPTATVKDIAAELKSLIRSLVGESGHAPRLSPLLEQLRLDHPAGGLQLMELGLVRLLVNRDSGVVHMLRRVPLEDLLHEAGNPYWHSTAVTPEWAEQHRSDVHASHSIESIWWRLLELSQIDLAQTSAREAPVRLAAWPELDAQVIDPQWLTALAYLMHESWHADALAELSGIDAGMIRRLLHVVVASGLASQAPQVAQAKPATSNAAAALTGSILKVAKRFGLKLFGIGHA